MAIIDGNTRKIKGTNLKISNLFILCMQPNPVLKTLQNFEVELTSQCYDSVESAAENLITNQLKIEGLVKYSKRVPYNRQIDGDVFTFADVKMKELLMEIFPDSDPDLITFLPPHEEAI